MAIEEIGRLFQAGAQMIFGGLRAAGKSTAESEILTSDRLAQMDINVDAQYLGRFGQIMNDANLIGRSVMNGVEVLINNVPSREIISPSLDIETFGLARVRMVNQSGQPEFTTHIPFTFHDAEIVNYQAILDRIEAGIEAGQFDEGDFYQAAIDRIEQAIRFHQIKGLDTNVSADIWGVTRTE